MKTLILLTVMMVGCVHAESHSPPEPPPATVVVVEKVPVSHSPVVQVEEKTEPPIKTWLTEEDLNQIRAEALSRAMEEAVKKDQCLCHAGDPLCSCLGN